MTTTEPDLHVSVSRVVPADPRTVWDHLTEVANLGDLSPENVSSAWRDDARGEGATFKGRNKIGFLGWSSVATVTGWEPGHRFAFVTSPPSRSTWVYDLEPVDGGTRVTETVTKDDAQPLPIRLMQRMVGVGDRAAHLRAGMETTLERLADALAAPTP